MQRRTNLFYGSGQDSNFITFSNYTEALTGSFISTDWKLFPSKFLCLDVDFTEDLTKEKFIKYLVSYYENKLAFVRDWCIYKNVKIEDNTLPLEWLLEAFVNFFGDSDHVRITFASEIVEQNYNGVYADTICTIDGTAKAYKYEYDTNEQPVVLSPIYYKEPPYTAEDERVQYLSLSYLYGWYHKHNDETEYTGPSEYINDNPKFDSPDGEWWYSRTPKYTAINRIDSNTLESIDFNIVIPLFDLTNINPFENKNSFDELTTIDLTTQLGGDEENKINIPLGIWFADSRISLKRDGSTGYAPAWSLVLSSQFKPFPYSSKLNADGPEGGPYDIQGIQYSEGAFVTFAQVLARQNEMITNFSKLSAQIAQLSSKIEAVDAKINAMGTSYAIDTLHTEMILFKNQVNNLLEQYNISTDSSLTWDAKFNG